MHFRADSERGFVSMTVLFAVAAGLFVLSLIFGIWAFTGYSDYKNNFDTKLASQVAVVRQQEDQAKDAAFAEAIKSPLATYSGPSTYGSVTVKYPKTWSGYVADTDGNSPFIDGYFYPGTVPDITQSSSVYALRIQVVDSSYSSELNNYSGNVQQGLSKVSPYSAPSVPKVIGVRITGQLANGKSGTMVMIPLRNMTLKIWTESSRFTGDFNNYILPNFTFAP